MNTHTSQAESEKEQVLIYTSDVEMVVALREYFESKSYEIFVNSHTVKFPVYTFICGNYIFVKSILEKNNFGDSKLCICIYDAYHEYKDKLPEKKYKVVFVDPKPLSKTSVQKILKFFFTAHEHCINIQTTVIVNLQALKPENEPKTPLYVSNGADEEQPSPRHKPIILQKRSASDEKKDSERILHTMREIFSSDIKQETKHNVRKSKYSKKMRSFIILIVAVIFLPALWYTIALTISLFSLAVSFRQIVYSNYKSSAPFIAISKSATLNAKIFLSTAAALHVPLPHSVVETQYRFISMLEDAQGLADHGTTLISYAKELTGGIFTVYGQNNPDTVSLASKLSDIRIELDETQNKTGLLLAQSRILKGQISPLDSIPFIREKINTGITLLDGLNSDITFVRNLITLYTYASGFDQKRTYLLLFQNSAELRPTGGFIGSLAKSTLSDGAIEELDVQDVYVPDGQLKGHLDPPLPIREIMKQEHWYLRDSNWDPDFRNSGSQATWFYEKETGVRSDGAVAISSPFIINILNHTGPIRLDEYNDTITADNFYGKTLYYAEDGFFPGSTQKKDFLGILLKQIITRITTRGGISPLTLLTSLRSSLEARDILFYFSDPKLQNLVTQMGWAGVRIPQNECPAGMSGICVTDSLDVIEANVGVNKVNPFIQRTRTHTVTIEPNGSISHSLTLNITNDAPLDQNPSVNTYTAYVRFYFPSGSTLSGITFNGTDIPLHQTVNTNPLVFPYYDMLPENGAVGSVGIALSMPPGQSVINLSYRKEHVFDASGNTPIIYRLVEPKQPGITKSETQTTILYPSRWRSFPVVTADNQTFVAKGESLEYNSSLQKDENIIITFIQGGI